MSGLTLLIPIALGMGFFGLLVFFWAMRTGQFEDLDGAAQRILIDDEDEVPMTAKLPQRVRSYKRTPSFSDDTVPAGLLSEHSTKEGTWGLIHVQEGRLRYVICDDRREPSEKILSADTGPGVVEPTIIHRVEPVGTVRFHVEFLR